MSSKKRARPLNCSAMRFHLISITRFMHKTLHCCIFNSILYRVSVKTPTFLHTCTTFEIKSSCLFSKERGGGGLIKGYNTRGITLTVLKFLMSGDHIPWSKLSHVEDTCDVWFDEYVNWFIINKVCPPFNWLYLSHENWDTYV